jgi:hypothetical protein
MTVAFPRKTRRPRRTSPEPPPRPSATGWLTYLVVAPHDSHALELTAHAYLGKAAVLAAALGLMSFLYWLAVGALKARRGHISLSSIGVALAGIQVVGFTVQEILERILTGASAHHLLPVLAVGIPLQILIAAAGALLVVGLFRAGEKIAAALGRVRFGRITNSSPPQESSASPKSPFPEGGLRVRGPPLLLNQ